MTQKINVATPLNIDRMIGMPVAPIGISQPKRSRSVNSAAAIQYSPSMWCPKPNHHPTANAALLLATPSIRKSRPGKATSSAGMK
jgi:hypothetical protein